MSTTSRMDLAGDLSRMKRASSNNKPIDMAELSVVQNKELAQMLSKMIRPADMTKVDTKDAMTTNSLVAAGSDRISSLIMSRKEDAENSFKLFPDLQIIAQTLITSLLSPKDMLQTKLSFKLKDSPLPANITAEITEIVRKAMVDEYKLEDRIYEIINRMAFMEGAAPMLVLPESAVDEVINRGQVLAQESIAAMGVYRDSSMTALSHKGFLGDPHEAPSKKNVSAMENLFNATLASMTYNETPFISERVVGDLALELDAKDAKYLTGLFKENTRITDNTEILKMPDVVEIARKQKVAEKTKSKLLVTASESAKVSPDRLYQMLYKSAPSDHQPYMAIPASYNLKRRSIGRPLEIALPAEAVAPIFIPGDPTKHLGYIVAIDIDGNPLSLSSLLSEYNTPTNPNNPNDRAGQGLAGLLTTTAKQNLISDNFVPQIPRMAELYGSLFENDIMERLSRGIHQGSAIELGKNEELVNIMFMRALRGRMTRILYVPAEYMTYYAFHYHRNGIGKSYMDDLSSVISMRAMVMYSKVWALVRSSISTINAKIQFDPNDIDPVKTIENVKHLVARSRQQYFPNGLRSVQSFTDWIHKAGIMVTWDNHPRLPNTHIDFEAKNIEHVMPKDDLEEMLRDMCSMHIGVPPELAVDGKQSEFATTVESKNLLLARRVLALGKTLAVHMSNHTRQVAQWDSNVLEAILNVLNNNAEAIMRDFTDDQKKDYEENKTVFTRYLCADIINRIEVSVPSPESTQSVNLKTEFDNYSNLLESVINSVISTDAFPKELFGEEVNNRVDAFAKAWKAELLRQYCATNNIVPEVFEMTTLDENGKVKRTMNDGMVEHGKNMATAMLDLLNRYKPIQEAITKDIANIAPPEADGSGGGSSDWGGDGGSGGEGGGGDDPFGDGGDGMGGLDDLGGGGSGEETPPEGGDNAGSGEEAPKDNDNPDNTEAT